MSLSVSNALGMSRAGPLVARGWSAEAPPTITPSRLRATKVESSTVELVWEWPSDPTGSVNGFFVGIRIEWCLDEKNQLCDRYKVTQVGSLEKFLEGYISDALVETFEEIIRF